MPGDHLGVRVVNNYGVILAVPGKAVLACIDMIGGDQVTELFDRNVRVVVFFYPSMWFLLPFGALANFTIWIVRGNELNYAKFCHHPAGVAPCYYWIFVVCHWMMMLLIFGLSGVAPPAVLFLFEL